MTETTLHVVAGEPSAQELAVVIALLAARATATPAAQPARSAWGRPQVRRMLTPGTGAWRGALR